MTGTGPLAVLVGPPGAGKTTVGTALAERLGVPLRDTDADVEQTAGKPIPDIFAQDGEPHFRALEAAAVTTALAEHSGVLSLGGGAILDPDTRALLRGHPVVLLGVSMAVGVRRTGLATNRPLLAGINPRATYRTLLEARMPLYREVAAVEIDTDELEVAQIVEQITTWLDLRPTETRG